MRNDTPKRLSSPVYGGSGPKGRWGGPQRSPIPPSVAFSDTSPVNGGGKTLRLRLAVGLTALLLLAACSNSTSTTVQGYAEGDYLYLSARDAGQITSVYVKEGDAVAKGAQIASLDAERAEANADHASQALIEAQADAKWAQQSYTRSQALRRDRTVAQATLDKAGADLNAANARVQAAQAALSQAKQDLADRTVFAPAAGVVEQVIRRAGERAGPNEPIVSLLPPENIKVRFFVPEPRLAQIKTGDTVSITCDGCASAMNAKVSFISTQAQFTPPFIYSREERQKLVYLVEARSEALSTLHPGQPVDVSFAK